MLARPLGAIASAAALLLGIYACGSDDGSETGTSSSCPEGVICGTGASGDPGGPGGGGPGGPGAGAGSTSGPGSGTGGGCVEAWLCTPWDGNGTDDGVRTCVDQNGCGTTDHKPVEAAKLPALDLNFYKCKVDPVMNQKCAQGACHGTEEGRALRLYHRGRLRNAAETVIEPGCLSAGTVKSLQNCIGSIECACFTVGKTTTEWQRNFDAARGLLLDESGAALADPSQSDMLLQPVVGGKPHTGVHLFAEGDADYQTIVDWLSGNTLGSCVTNN